MMKALDLEVFRAYVGGEQIQEEAMSEVNYNDGKWHGHNGGGCPVHPETVVEFLTTKNGVVHTWLAKEIDWLLVDNPVVAFRVINEHKENKEPRQWWCVLTHMFDTRESAERFDNDLRAANPGMNFGPIFRVREVLE